MRRCRGVSQRPQHLAGSRHPPHGSRLIDSVTVRTTQGIGVRIMLKRALAGTVVVAVMMVMATGLAHAGSTPWEEPPLADATAVALMEAKRGSDNYVLQQWNSAQDGTAIRMMRKVTSPQVGPSRLGFPTGFDTVALFRNGKPLKKTSYLSVWQVTYSPAGTSLQPTAGWADANGVTVFLPPGDNQNGRFVVVLNEANEKRAQWECSVYWYDLCRWSNGYEFLDYTALAFTMKDGQVSTFNVTEADMLRPKQYKKRLGKVLARK